MATTSAWTFIVCIIMLQNAAGHRAGGDNCCNGNKILDTIQKILKRGGHKGDNHHPDHHFVAFSAYLGKDLTITQDSVVLNFDKTVTNFGNTYKDGIFTCPTSGLYAFDWSIVSLYGKVGEAILILNGKRLGYKTWADGRSRSFGASSISTVLKLKEKDRVWINSLRKQYGHFHGEHSAFRGWLLHKL